MNCQGKTDPWYTSSIADFITETGHAKVPGHRAVGQRRDAGFSLSALIGGLSPPDRVERAWPDAGTREVSPPTAGVADRADGQTGRRFEGPRLDRIFDEACRSITHENVEPVWVVARRGTEEGLRRQRRYLLIGVGGVEGGHQRIAPVSRDIPPLREARAG